jgi:Na+-transporting NADH:ubiquinone oxidoreductase subunit A
MSKVIKLKKGFDINLAGKAEKKFSDISQPETFAFKPDSFHGIIRSKVMVDVGDTVKAGTPILFDKKNPKIKHVAPVSGEVVEIRRGEKRKLLEIVILADKEIVYEEYAPQQNIDTMTREEVLDNLLKGGTWANLVQRPFGVLADPDETPKAIFISGFDSHPLAPDYNMLFKHEDQKYFQAGIEVMKKLTPGSIHLSIDAEEETPALFTNCKGVELHKFSGPHPAGNVGVQIHHIDPINKGDIVWTISPYGILQIGKFFLNGKYDASKMVALAGSEVKEPRYYKTYIGANIKNMVNGNISSNNVRYISGNVLTGTRINSDGHMGYFDNLVTVIPEGDQYELFGWIKPTTNKLSFQRAFGLLSFLNPNKEFVVDTNTKGEPRAFVQTGIFERVTPMDILPTYLLKAIMAEDYEDMESLGIYEIIEEDLALCEFVDVSKHNVQAIVREGLDLIQYS